VSLYTAMPGLASIYGRQLIGTLHERTGGEGEGPSPASQGSIDPAWARIIGQHGHREGDQKGIFGGEPEARYNFGALQIGLDLYRGFNDDGTRDTAGVYAAYGHGDAEVEHNLLNFTFDAGEDTFDALSAGAYWTHFGEDDWYVGAVVQATWYDMSMTGHRGLHDGDTQGWGFAISLEAGYPIPLGDGWVIEPETQFVYQGFDIDSFNDGAADIDFRDLNSAAGRLGLRLGRDWVVKRDHGQGAPQHFSAYGQVDVWNEFLGEPTTQFSSQTGPVDFSADLGGTWTKLSLGASLELTPSTMLYGNVGYDTSFDGDATAYEGKLGVKITW
jgi:outer membrane autotransporter protein